MERTERGRADAKAKGVKLSARRGRHPDAFRDLGNRNRGHHTICPKSYGNGGLAMS
jgi:hypothetical protein